MESKLLISQFLTFLTARRASTKKVPAIFRSNAVGLPAALLAVTLLASCQADGPIPAALRGEGNDKPLELMIPDSLQKRHEAFRAEFVKATKEGGKVGDAARTIEKLGTDHFAKAKDVFPSLGVLPVLAEGKVTPEMGATIKVAETLRADLPQIRREHRDLVAGLKKLAEVAMEDEETDYVRFAERLILHIQEENEVLYPTVLLIGDYVKRGLDK